jgi:NAD(P)-dependent dehydrogenase (short-subunit alcohol dehydrogenase family)
MDLFNLTGKVAVITGSSRGIGRSIAIQLARAGARVVISSRKLGACEEVVRSIRAEGGEAMAIGANISEPAQLQALVARTRSTWGGIDILVCNAASNPYYGPLAELPDEAFDKIMHNNVLSNLWLCKLVHPDMKAKKDGAIVIVSSIGGLHGSPVIGAYNISKAADMQLARNLAVEWGPDNIRVNCIAPGLIRTDFARALHENPAMRAKVEGETPLRRIGEPDDIGGIAVLLASAAGRYITGQTLVADGRMTIRLAALSLPWRT